MERLAEKLRADGKRPYIIPRGGSSAASLWGYIDCWREMEQQDFFSDITDIVVVSGNKVFSNFRLTPISKVAVELVWISLLRIIGRA